MEFELVDQQDYINKIRRNDVSVFRQLTSMIIHECTGYGMILKSAGRESAHHFLTESLIVFRRQVLDGTVSLKLRRGGVQVNGLEIQKYLDELILLLYQINLDEKSEANHQKMIYRTFSGSPSETVNRIREVVFMALSLLGCSDENEQQEIFQESLFVMWSKAVNGLLGITSLAGHNQDTELIIYNRQNYQFGKISSYCAGIAGNLYKNRLKIKQSSRVVSYNSAEHDFPVIEDDERVTTDIMLFIIYRALIEERRIRSAVSLLQYDCGLDEREICLLTGLSNARFHSSRLRKGFRAWYVKNHSRLHHYLDSASQYFEERDAKISRFNQKFTSIDKFVNKREFPGPLDLFQEEIRNKEDFKKYHLILMSALFLVSAGKIGSQTRLSGEETLRGMMTHYQKGLFRLHKEQSILFLLFYGTDEPESVVLNLLETIFPHRVNNHAPVSEMVQHDTGFVKNPSLADELFSTNQSLLSYIYDETTQLNLV